MTDKIYFFLLVVIIKNFTMMRVASQIDTDVCEFHRLYKQKENQIQTKLKGFVPV